MKRMIVALALVLAACKVEKQGQDTYKVETPTPEAKAAGEKAKENAKVLGQEVKQETKALGENIKEGAKQVRESDAGQRIAAAKAEESVGS